MRVRVDRGKCTGHGRCYVLAPEVYQPDEEGCCVIPNEHVSAEHAANAERAARNCPEDAIQVFMDQDQEEK